MALRYDALHNRFQNIRYNTAHKVDDESLRRSRSMLLTIDENYEVAKLLNTKVRFSAAGVVVGILGQLLLKRMPAFSHLHGYTRGFVRAACLVLPWAVPSRYYAYQINQANGSAMENRLHEFYVNPISRKYVI